MSFIKELKRRNVIRVGIGYAVVAWLMIEISATTFPMLQLPSWTATFVMVLLLMGFPVALIFAWAYEMTPEGLKKEKDVVRSESITHITGRKLDFLIISVLAVALVLIAVERFILLPDRAPANNILREITKTEIQQAIAVLPFVNISPDPDQEYFSDGLSEELLNLLAKIPELKVIGRTSSFAFKGKNEDLRVIGQKLGVTRILAGSVRKAGNELRITAELIDVSDASNIWTHTYQRTMTDIFAVQDDVAAAIIDALQIHVSKNPTRGRPTENREAYMLFLKAKASINVSNRRDAEDFLRQAIELDPNFAEAYELLGDVYWGQAGADLEAVAAQKRMGEAAAKALAIEPDLVYARVMYQVGNVETYSFLKEIEVLESASRDARSKQDVLGALTFDLMTAGYLQETVDLAEHMVELEPLSPDTNIRLFDALIAVGRTSDAMRVLEFADQLNTNSTNWYVSTMHLLDKQDDAAIARFETFVENDGLPSNWVRDLLTGARDPATGPAYLKHRIPQILATMPEQKAAQWRRYLPYFFLFFGYLDELYELILATDLTDSNWTDAQNLVYAGIKFRRLGFTAHPQFLGVAERLGLIHVWDERGPPDFCEKISGEWICE
jgi:TolB-like protein